MNTILSNGAIAAWVQASIYFITLIVLIYQLSSLRKQTTIQINTLKEQVRNSKYADYTRCQVDMTDTLKRLFFNKFHDEVYTSLSTKAKSKFNVDWTQYSAEDKTIYAFFEILYELFERVYCTKVYDAGYNIIDEQEWSYWESWIEDIIRHPVFNDVHIDNLGMFDKEFEKLITDKLIKVDNYKNYSS